jgi:ubiquitin-protein ligase
MEKNAIKRILNKDIKEIEKLNLKSMGIYIDFNEDNLLNAKAMIVGPKDSLYEGGFLFFNINFPKNYPFSPPDVTYISRNKVRIHPNIYVGNGTSGFGKVCLSILGTWSGPKWTSIMDITTVLIVIQSLLDSNPLHHEPGQENNNTKQNDLYNEIIKYESINTLHLKNLNQTPHGFEVFKEFMLIEKEKYNDSIIQFLQENKNNPKKNIQVGFYRINIITDYKYLYEQYIKD